MLSVTCRWMEPYFEADYRSVSKVVRPVVSNVVMESLWNIQTQNKQPALSLFNPFTEMNVVKTQ